MLTAKEWQKIKADASRDSPIIRYADSSRAWKEYEEFLKRLILESGATTICEVGGGANPSISREFAEKYHLDYTVLDISIEELRKAPAYYNTLCADICDSGLQLPQKFDLVFSKMLAEHVKNGSMFYSNILKILNPGGVSFHFFPTLYAFPFLLNRLIPESFSYYIVNKLQPRKRIKEGNKGKFPAYYRLCRGPNKKQIKQLQHLGFSVVYYLGFFGYSSYFKRIPFMQRIHENLTSFQIKHPNPWFTSFAYMVLKK